jgi:CRP-like cAMP-binding protein
MPPAIDGSVSDLLCTPCLAAHIIDAGRREPLERLAHFLLEMLARLQAVGCASESSFEMPLSQKGIGDVVGLSAPHLNRMLAELRILGEFRPTYPGRTPIQDRRR